MSRIIGIDWGSRRIGLSHADKDMGLAFPLPAATQPSPQDRLQHILDVIKKESAQEVVIGYPLHMNGEAGSMAQLVDEFIASLQDASSVIVHRVDERLSSQAADRLQPLKKRLSPQEKIKERRSGSRDSRAATVILQDFLDQQLPTDDFPFEES